MLDLSKNFSIFTKTLLFGFLLLSAIRVFAQTQTNSTNSDKHNNQPLHIESLLHNSKDVFWVEKPVADYATGCYGYYDFPSVENLEPNKSVANSTLFIKANKADYAQDQLLLNGDLSIKLNNLQIQADSAQLNLETGKYEIDGNVDFAQNSIFLHSDSLSLDTNSDTKEIFNAHFVDSGSNMHAAARHLQNVGSDKIILNDGVFTTCPPQNKSWYMKATQIELDKKAKRLSATNLRFYMAEIPVFYLPWISISLDKSRVSGFLTPSFKYSSENGFDLGLPFYINIHPQLDATIIGRYISKRGIMFQGETRYLLAEKVFGDFRIGYLSKDKKANLVNRWYVSTKHSGYFGEHFNYMIDFSQISDVSFNKDIDLANANLSANQFLQLFELNTSWQNWNLTARVKGYQSLAGNLSSGSQSFSQKYDFFNLVKGRTKDQGFYQLPQILLRGSQKLNGAFNFSLTTELTYFDKLLDDKINQDADLLIKNSKPIWSSPSALRLVLEPKISADFRNSWGFISPEVGLIYTYSMMLPRKNQAYLAQAEKVDAKFLHLQKLVPSFGVNMGLTLDRLREIAGVEYLQSLTPKLYLGYTPYINNKVFNQEFMPFIYDGGEASFSESELFSAKRLSGYDRVGDLTMITLALNHTWLRNADSKHKFSFDFMQGFYPTRRRIGSTMDEDIFAKTRILSPFIAKINWNILDDLLWSNKFYFDWQSINSLRFFERVESSLNWNNKFMSLAIGYLYASEHSKLAQDKLKTWNYKERASHQLSASGVFNLSNNWRMFGKYVRYLKAGADKQHIAGIEYNNCCWQIQLLYSDKLKAEPSYNAGTKKFSQPVRDYSVLFNITFKGIGSAGNDINSFLRSEISGFRAKQSSGVIGFTN